MPVPSDTGPSNGFVIEDTAEGTDLVVTSDWSPAAAEILLTSRADGLTLNYARGYRERSLDFLQDEWPVRRLKILARTIKDLSPLYRLGGTLESLSVETSPEAVLDLGKLPHLRRLGADWQQIRASIEAAGALRRLFVMGYREPDLRAIGEHRFLVSLVMKERPRLQSLAGLDLLPSLTELGMFGAPNLCDISDLAYASGASKLRRLELQANRGVDRLDALAAAVGLEFLNVSECGDVESLRPLITLRELRKLFLYGTTRVADGDLAPLLRLPNLVELRMQNRREYRPSVPEVKSHILRLRSA